jgi:hypothetical protein
VSDVWEVYRIEDPEDGAKEARAEEEGEHFEAIELHFGGCGGCSGVRGITSRPPFCKQLSWRTSASTVIRSEIRWLMKQNQSDTCSADLQCVSLYSLNFHSALKISKMLHHKEQRRRGRT